MQTSRFQLSLLATMAVALGFSLASSPATGYPSTGVVSLGTNPVRSATGHWDLSGPSASESAVISATADQDLILTEVTVGLTQNSDSCWASGRAQLQLDTGEVLASIPVHNPHLVYAQANPLTLRFSSGLRVPAASSVTVQWDFVSHACSFTQYDFDYLISGYLATP